MPNGPLKKAKRKSRVFNKSGLYEPGF